MPNPDPAQLELGTVHPSVVSGVSLHSHPYIGPTSQEAWESVRNCGWATRAAKQAYRILYERGPLTLLELEHAAAEENNRVPKGRSESTIIRRLSDLRDNGLAEPTGQTRMCAIKRKPLVTWHVTNKLAPDTKLERKKHCPHCGKELTTTNTKPM